MMGMRSSQWWIRPTRWTAVAALAVLASAAARAAAPAEAGVDDPAVRRVLEKIRNISPYDVPQLELKREGRYADTAEDVAPYSRYPIEPYKRFFLTQMEYTGPGRAIPEPEHVDAVRIGFIGPIQQTVSVATGGRLLGLAAGRKMLQGAQLAVEQANARGGYAPRGAPYELMIHNDNGLWGASGNEIIKMAYDEGVWAILGTIDGANTHIAIRVALKCELTVLNTGDTDPTLVETNIPWIIRVIGDDRKMGYLLVDYLYRKLGVQRLGVIRASNRYGRFGVREILDGSRRLGRPAAVEMAYEVGQEDFTLHLQRLERADVDAVVHWGEADDGGRILKQMRERGMEQPFFACDRCLDEAFVRAAGPYAEGVVCTSPWNPDRRDPKLDAFRKAFRARFGEEAETFAAHAYDGMNMLIWAIETAGLNRARIRDVLAHRRRPWPGVTGSIPLSAALDDAGPVFLARREHGRWVYYSREQLAIPGGPLADAR